MDRPNDLVVDVLRTSGSGGRIRLLRGASADAAGWTDARWVSDLPADQATYDEAIAMPVVSAADGTNRVWGALYTREGRLIPHSVRAKSNRAWSHTPPELDRLPDADMPRIDGETYYAGHFRKMFGHVLLETLPRLWPELDFGTYDTVLVHPQRVGRRSADLELAPYADRLLAAAMGRPVPPRRMVAARPVRLARVTVASPAFWLQGGFSPAARPLFDRIADELTPEAGVAPGGRPRRIYLSRSRLAAPARRAVNEAEVEQIVAAAGFSVVHPQELPITEQVALVRGADAIAGCDGSALHLAAFARTGTTLLALDSRPVVNQLVIDHLSQLDAVHVAAAAADVVHGRQDSWLADLARVDSALALAGLVA